MLSLKDVEEATLLRDCTLVFDGGEDGGYLGSYEIRTVSSAESGLYCSRFLNAIVLDKVGHRFAKGQGKHEEQDGKTALDWALTWVFGSIHHGQTY